MEERKDKTPENGDCTDHANRDEPNGTNENQADETDSGFVTYGSGNHATNVQETHDSPQTTDSYPVTEDARKHLQGLSVEPTPHHAVSDNTSRMDGESASAKFVSDVDKLTDDQQIQYALMISMETNQPEETTETLDVKHHSPPPSEVDGCSMSSSSSTAPRMPQLDALLSLVMAAAARTVSVTSSTEGTDTREEQEETAEITKQCIKKNRVKFIESLDVHLMEHLLQPHLASVTRQHENKTDKVRALLDRLLLDPEEQNIIFLHIISGLYPSLVKETTGETPTTTQTDVCINSFCADLKKTVEEKGNVPTRGRKICLHTQCIDTQMRLVKEKEVLEKDGQDIKQKVKDQLETIQSEREEHDHDEDLGDDDVLPEIYQGYLEGSLTKIKAEDLLSNIKPGAILLLRGRAGIGKTTTAQWLAQQWRKGKWARGYKVAFVLNLRYLATLKYSMTLSELLTQYSVYNPSEAHPQFPLWMSNHSSQILIFLEGLDELSDLERMIQNPKGIQAHQDGTATPIEWVINIILCNVLPLSCKFITSRPFTALKLLDCQRTVELLGLTRSAVKEFIQRNVKEDRQTKVQLGLESNPHLLSVCGITFYCAALCQLLEAGVDLSDEQHLNTYTRITSFLVLETPYHHTAEVSQGPYTKAQGLGDVLPPLARLAKYGLLQGNEKEKLTLNQADFLHAKIRCQEQKDMEKSGLISSLTIKDPRSKEHQLTQYLHLSLQEILAAAEVLQSDEAQIEAALKRMSHSGRLNMAELFLVGLALDKESEWVTALREGVAFHKPEDKPLPDAATIVSSFCLDILKDNGNQSDCLRGVQAVYESRDRELAKKMSEKLGLKEEVAFSSTSLTSIDVNALLFVWQHIENIGSIALTDVNLDDFSLEILQSFIRERKTIKDINLNGNQITDNGVAKLFSAELQNRFTVLSLKGNPITDQGVNCIAKSLEEDTSLRAMNLEETSITNNGLLSLMKALCIRGKPVRVSVSKHLNKDLRRVLGKGGLVTEATSLNLRRSGIDKVAICNLATLLEHRAHITKLILSENQIDDDSTSRLSEALRENTILEELNLSHNLIRDVGASCLAETLTYNRGLKELCVSSNPITEVGLTRLGDVLTRNPHMNRLCLDLDTAEFVTSRKGRSNCPLLPLGLNWNKTIVLTSKRPEQQKYPVLELRLNSKAQSSDKGLKFTDSSESDNEQRHKNN